MIWRMQGLQESYCLSSQILFFSLSWLSRISLTFCPSTSECKKVICSVSMGEGFAPCNMTVEELHFLLTIPIGRFHKWPLEMRITYSWNQHRLGIQKYVNTWRECSRRSDESFLDPEASEHTTKSVCGLVLCLPAARMSGCQIVCALREWSDFKDTSGRRNI